MRKSFVLCLAIIMCLFAVTGSIAYFTDSITVQGEVKSGNLDIEQFELERTADGSELQTYTQGQAIYPSVGTASHPATAMSYDYSTKDKAGNEVTGTLSAALMADTLHGYMDKIVVVKNNGSLPTYVRTFVAVPTAFAQAVHLDWNTEDGWSVVSAPFEDFITVDEHKISNVKYTIYYVTNEKQLASGASAAPSLLGFYLDSQVNHDGNNYILNTDSGIVELGSSSDLKILVATQASQAIPTGIGENTTRAGAVDSLNETYDEKDEQGKITVIHHPWMAPKSTQP